MTIPAEAPDNPPRIAPDVNLVYPLRPRLTGQGEVTEWLKVHAWKACVR